MSYGPPSPRPAPPLSTLGAAAGVVFRSDLPKLIRRAGFPALLGMFLLVQFWSIIPWPHLFARLSQDPGACAVALLVLVALPVSAVRVLPPVPTPIRLATPRAVLGWLRGPTALLLLAPFGLFVVGVDGGLGLLFPMFVSINLGISGVWPGLLLAPLAAVAPVVAHGLGVLMLTASGWWPVATVSAAPPWRRIGPPRGAWSALLWRDLVALWRVERGVVTSALWVAVPAGVLGWGFRANGGLRGAALGEALALALCCVAPGAGAALAGLRRALGAGFDRPAWPVGSGRRISSLWVVALLWLLPTSSALAAGGGLGVEGAAVGVVPGALAAAAVWVVARKLTFDHGIYLGCVVMVGGLVMAEAYGVMLCLTAGFLARAARILRRSRP